MTRLVTKPSRGADVEAAVRASSVAMAAKRLSEEISLEFHDIARSDKELYEKEQEALKDIEKKGRPQLDLLFEELWDLKNSLEQGLKERAGITAKRVFGAAKDTRRKIDAFLKSLESIMAKKHSNELRISSAAGKASRLMSLLEEIIRLEPVVKENL